MSIHVIPHLVRSKKITGSSYKEVYRKARKSFSKLKTKTKRKVYIRSAYFNKKKVFFDYFWPHLLEKRHLERMNRLKYFDCALELIKDSRQKPLVKKNTHHHLETLYRFYGINKDKNYFAVQIKERKRSKGSQLQLISIFAIKNKKIFR